MRFEEMKPDDYLRAKEAAPIAYLPWGAHEWHGRHNPLGLDTLKAHGQCLAMCAETGGVVFPEVYCGTDTMKTAAGFNCTLNFDIDTVKALARDYLDQLADEGFRVIVVLMGHYGGVHVNAIREVAEEFNSKSDIAVAWAFPDYEPTAEDGYPAEHAARCETSYIMWFRPELVDLTRLPADGDIEFARDGVAGEDPRRAAARTGRNGVESLVRRATPRVLELLEEMKRRG